MSRRSSSSNAEKSSKVEKTTWGSGGLFANRDLGAIFLILVTPLAVFGLFFLTNKYCNGSLKTFCEYLYVFIKSGFKITVDKDELWTAVTPFDPVAWKYIGIYMVFELFLMKFVPGKEFKSTLTATGHQPVYNANGLQCYFISIVTLVALKYQNYFKGVDVYDKMGNMLSSMNLFALCFCAFLTIKGLNFPSTKDSGATGSYIQDFFWGTELYPRILGWDVKQFTNCRFGMMFWQLGIICYAMAQYENLGYISSTMLVSVVVQSVYVAKFFLWETGYFCSMDIQHDRAGYYICWGCLVWVPSMYTVHTYYLVQHSEPLSLPLTVVLLVLGILSVYINYDCDRQRQEFRKTNGKSKIWGKAPTYVVGEYTVDGKVKTSLLLTSGWWGLARHFHYIPEILASVFWCMPSLFAPNADFFAVAIFYPIYLTLLLTDRAWRDDKRCADKYGESWKVYCKEVPYKIIPGII